MNPLNHLSVTESTGARTNRNGVELYSTPCPKCGHDTREGEVITKVFRMWWHAGCAKQYLERDGSGEVWRVLGRQLADHPSRFNVTTTRAIVENLLRMIPVPESEEGEYE